MRVPLVLLTVLFLLSACSDSITIRVLEDGEDLKISESKPVVLEILGNENDITVLEGTEVIRLIINGSQNDVHLPNGADPLIEDNGAANDVE